MTDRSIRLLERALAASPDDASPRLELAHALARVGRRREALSRLGLATLPEESFATGKALADELWEHELGALTLALVVPVPLEDSVVVDPTGRLAAWVDRVGLKVVSLETGRVLHDQRGTFDGVMASPGRIFVNDEIEIACFTLRDGELQREAGHAFDYGQLRLYDASPDGDRLLLGHLHHGRGPQEGVYTFPAVEPVVIRPAREDDDPIVDWGSGHLVLTGPGQALDLRRGHAARARRLDASHMLRSLGQGVLADVQRGVVLHGLASRWKLTLVGRRAGDDARPSLSRDGRGVRVHGAGRGWRIEVDTKRGRLRARVPRGVVAANEDSFVHWHPTADIYIDGTATLRMLDGTELKGLPKNLARSQSYWCADGHVLVVHRRTRPYRLEVWRGS